MRMTEVRNLFFKGTITLCFLAMTSSLLSCQRAKEEDKSSTLYFHLPQPGVSTLALAPTSLNMIMLNISGPGISPPILWRWSRHEVCAGATCNSNTVLPPTSISIPNVPMGSGRLVQTLLIGKDPATGGENFYYAEAVKNLTAASETVALSPVLSGNSITTGNAAGQLLSSAGVGPTGRLSMAVIPPGASAPMIVDRREIFNGYFNIFLLDGVNMIYQLDGEATPLFDNVNISSTMFTTPSNRVIRVTIPAHNQKRYENSTNVNEVRGAEKILLGYWGRDGFDVSTKRSCYYNVTPYQVDRSRYQTYNGSVWSSPLLWDFSNPGGDKVSLDSGFGTAVGSCTGDQFVDYFKFYPTAITGEDGEYGGFQGPYKFITDGETGGLVSNTYNPVNQVRTVRWDYLPGVISAGGITGSTVFAKVGSGLSTESYRTMSGFSCDRLSAYGFEEYDVAGSAATNNRYTLTGVAYANSIVIVCPYKLMADGKKDYFNSGITSKEYSKTGLALGTNHACVSQHGQSVKCWGLNSTFQLGTSTTANTGLATTGNLGSSAQIVRTIAGDASTCVLYADGTIRCVGSNTYGELGVGTTSNYQSNVQTVNIPALNVGEKAVDLAGGHSHYCFLTNNQRVFCWGKNAGGEALQGVATPSQLNSPSNLSSLTSVVQLSAGFNHTCAVISDGSVKCWGKNDFGQVGNGTSTSSPTAPAIALAGGVEKVRAGYQSTCAVLATGELRCWGHNSNGQLGLGNTTHQSAPVSVLASSHRVVDAALGLSTSSEAQTCALLSGGSARCWANNADGQLGNGNQSNVALASSNSAFVTHAPFKNIKTGSRFTCGVLFNDSVFCWGVNTSGRVGDGSTATAIYDTPRAVSGQDY